MENQMNLYMLDTNMASYIIKGKPTSVRYHLQKTPLANICVSTITQAELLRGTAKKPDAKQLAIAVKEFLLRVDILPWDSDAAEIYAHLRTTCEREGFSLGTMDMLIASHSIAARAVLVTNDQAFYRINHHLSLEDWTRNRDDH